jgi:nitroreductase
VELDLALRTTASIRSFRPDPIPDDMLFRILDHARFAGSGGNRQGWRVVVVKNGAIRRRLREIYVPIFAEYLDGLRRGLVSYSPDWAPGATSPPSAPNEFADQLDRVPVLLVVLAELGTLAITDRDLARPSIVAGASVYPFVQNVLLAARGEGLGGVLTTMLCRAEPEVAALLHIPPTHAMAAMLALGFPELQPTRLKRRPVSSFTTLDRFDGPHFIEAGD